MLLLPKKVSIAWQPVIALIAEADKNKYVLPAFGGFQSLWKEFETQELTFGGQTGRNHVNSKRKCSDHSKLRPT